MDIAKGLAQGSMNAGLLVGLVWIIVATLLLFITSVNLMKRRLIV